MLIDYFQRPVRVGDILRSVGWSSGGGFPLYATDTPLTVVALYRTRVEVTGPNFTGTIRVLPGCAAIVERDGKRVVRSDLGGIDRITGRPFTEAQGRALA